MRRSAVALLFGLIGGIACMAQVPNGSEAKKVDELETLSNAWMQAAKDHDTKTLEGLMGDDFRYVHPSVDKVGPRAQWLANLANMETQSFRYQQLKVDRYGKSVAVVSSILKIASTLNGQPRGGAVTSCIDVWEKRHGKWQVVARYATRPEEVTIVAPKPAATPVITSVTQMPGSSEVKKPDELQILSQAWMTAAKDHDMKTLESLMASDFRLVHPSQDNVTTREQWLSNLKKVETTRFAYQHLKVDHYGKLVAVVSAIFRVDAVNDGAPFGGPKTSTIDVWEKRRGKWQVVTRYATRPEEIGGIKKPAADQTPKPN